MTSLLEKALRYKKKEKDPETAIIKMLDICDKVIKGTYNVTVESDDSGAHLQVWIEGHSRYDISDIPSRFEGYRTIVVKVPVGYIKK